MLAVHHIKLHCTLLAVSVWNRQKCILWSTFPSQFTRTVYCCHGVHSWPINRMQGNARCICVLAHFKIERSIETKYRKIDGAIPVAVAYLCLSRGCGSMCTPRQTFYIKFISTLHCIVFSHVFSMNGFAVVFAVVFAHMTTNTAQCSNVPQNI